jgi:hypothetical protein
VNLVVQLVNIGYNLAFVEIVTLVVKVVPTNYPVTNVSQVIFTTKTNVSEDVKEVSTNPDHNV